MRSEPRAARRSEPAPAPPPGATLASAVEGIEWPALVDSRVVARLALLEQLEESQWWPPPALEREQLRQLRCVVGHAARHVPLYRERLQAAGLAADAPITPAAWRRMALLDRRDLQEGRIPACPVPAEHGGRTRLISSGSTGEPVIVTGTGLTQLFWQAFTLRDHLWQRRDPGARLAVIRADAEPFRPRTAPVWGSATHGLYRTGPAGALGIATDVSVQARWLAEFDPDYLLTHPSNLVALAEYLAQHGLALPRLRQASTFGETCTAAARRACAEVLRVPLVDGYSSQEIGYVALQCPDVPENYHVQAENLLVEILDEQDRPCPPGRAGRVVVSTLHNFAMPLLRYDLRDYAEPGPPCPCGRGLPVLRRILGRERNMLVMPSGERRWPLTGYRDYDAIAPVRQYQLIQHDRERVEARLVVARPLAPGEETALREHLQRTLGHAFRIDLVYMDAIPRGPGGKYEDFISHAR